MAGPVHPPAFPVGSSAIGPDSRAATTPSMERVCPFILIEEHAYFKGEMYMNAGQDESASRQQKHTGRAAAC